MQITNLVRKT